MPSKNLAIMFTDIKGFTERTAKESRNGVRKLLKEHERTLVPPIRHFGGNIVKSWGDAFVVTFESPTNAVLCGLVIQDSLRRHNEGVPEKERIEVRVAVNAGEVDVSEDDVHGDAVNIAARLEAITEANEIYFTEAVYLAMVKQEVPSSEIGFRKFKGIPEAVKIYKVIQDPASDQYKTILEKVKAIESGGPREPFPELPRPRAKHANIPLGIAIGVLVGLAGGIVAMLFLPGKASRVEEVKNLIEQGKYLTAIGILEPILRETPDDPEVRLLMERAIRGDIEPFSKEKRYSESLESVRSYRKRYPELKELGQLEMELRLGALEQIFINDTWSQAPMDAALEMEKAYPEEEDVFYTVGRLFQSYLNDNDAALWHYLRALEKGTKHRKDKTIFEAAKERISRDAWGRYSGTAREILREYFLEEILPFVREGVKSDDKNLRMNSYLLLKEKGMLEGVDEIEIHEKNLFAEYDPREACDFFAALGDKAGIERSISILERARKHFEEKENRWVVEYIDEALAKLRAKVNAE